MRGEVVADGSTVLSVEARVAIDLVAEGTVVVKSAAVAVRCSQ